mgnify:CR=1 FL=1
MLDAYLERFTSYKDLTTNLDMITEDNYTGYGIDYGKEADAFMRLVYLVSKDKGIDITNLASYVVVGSDDDFYWWGTVCIKHI